MNELRAETLRLFDHQKAGQPHPSSWMDDMGITIEQKLGDKYLEDPDYRQNFLYDERDFILSTFESNSVCADPTSSGDPNATRRRRNPHRSSRPPPEQIQKIK